jgi:transcription initiation factor IIE alpha subunit
MNLAINFANMNNQSKNIFSLIQKKGPLTKNEIINATNIKLTKSNRLMDPLEKAKLIVESSIGDSSGGCKPILYLFYDVSKTVALKNNIPRFNRMFFSIKGDILKRMPLLPGQQR